MTQTAQIIDFSKYAKRREEPQAAFEAQQTPYFWVPVWVMVPQQAYAPLPHQAAQNS